MRKLTSIGKTAAILYFLFWGYCIGSYIVNVVKLVQCDFAGPVWKEEILHGLGLIPPINLVMCWF